MGIDKRKLPECPKDDTCVAYDDASWRSEGWVLLVIGILMFLGGPLCLCCIKKVRKKVLKCFGACCSSFGECCSFLACAPCKCFLTCGSACGSCCAMLFPHEESGSNVDEDEYYKALRTYEDRHKLLLKRVEEEKEDPPATLSVNISRARGPSRNRASSNTWKRGLQHLRVLRPHLHLCLHWNHSLSLRARGPSSRACGPSRNRAGSNTWKRGLQHLRVLRPHLHL